MQAKAITQYNVPNYPQKQEVRNQPSLLRKDIRKRWQKLYDLGISGMLIASLSLSGCNDESSSSTATSQTNIEQNPDNSNSTAKAVNQNQVIALVAPIFEHGEGRGAVGCEVIAPPAFISEDEALVIIKEELSKHGIVFNKEKVLLKEVTITPGRDELFGNMNDEQRKEIQELLSEQKGIKIEIENGKPAPLEIDLQDSEKEINVEYICREEYNKLGGSRSASTVQNYEIKSIAQQVRNKIQADAKNGIYCVFYDPFNASKVSSMVEEPNLSLADRWELAPKKALELTKKQLKQQVSDFAKWLKEQGVI